MTKSENLASSVNPNSINGSRLVDLSVPGGKIADGAVTDVKVGQSAAISSSKSAFLQRGPLANSRTVEGKLRDTLSVKDFGAVGDGVADDTQAIKDCFAAAQSLAAGSACGFTILFPQGSYRISDTLILPRAFANESFMEVRGDGYLSTAIIWDGPADRIMIDGSNQPRLCVHDLRLAVANPAAKPAYGLAHWGAPDSGQHSSHQRIENLFITGMKVGMAGRQTEGYVNSSGVAVPAGAAFTGCQDSIFCNILVESCDIGVVSGHTHNQYDQLRLVNTTNLKVITSAFTTYNNCYFAGDPPGTTSAILIIDQNGGGFTNLQIFNNCWFEGGGPNRACFSIQSTGPQYGVPIVINNSNVADAGFLCRTSGGVSASFTFMGNINFGAGGVSTTNRFDVAAGSTVRTSFEYWGAPVFSNDGPGTLTQTSLNRPGVSDFLGIGAQVAQDSLNTKFLLAGDSAYKVNGKIVANPSDPAYYSDVYREAGEGLKITTVDFGYSQTAVSMRRGNVGINVAQPSYELQLSTDSAGKPASATWTVTSDERLKENIEAADLDVCVETIKQLRLRRFRWRDGIFSEKQTKDRHRLGWIAQEVEELMPKAVVDQTLTTKDGESLDCKGLDSDQIYAAMFGALQRFISKVELLEERVAELERG